ncbi:methionine sulfoxide reductase B [Ramicandelaber brevisporus]|nr:methionine sulfoxide reductase B [Ramicandelaber brevisporus]
MADSSTAAAAAAAATAAAKPAPTEEELRKKLTPLQYRVLRESATEPANSSALIHHKDVGVYQCAACEAPLYKSDTKFSSGCGWPAFFDNIPGAVNRKVDSSYGMKRIEITCANCNSHLGHVFEGEGFNTPTDQRHCVNGVCLLFTPEDKN